MRRLPIRKIPASHPSLRFANAPEAIETRAEALAASPRVTIDTPSLTGSMALKGARLDDVSLKAYRETMDPTSPNIVLLSPSGAPAPYYAETGFLVGCVGRRRLAAARAATRCGGPIATG